MTCLGKTLFLICHVLLHVVGYLLPRLVRWIAGLLIVKPCRRAIGRKTDYIWRPEREARVIHHPTLTECVTDVFGLMDVKAHPLLDRQFCWGDVDAAERQALEAKVQECSLEYTSPLYCGHISTIVGAFRPGRPVEYKRVEMTAWDGCPLMMDWLYVEGEEPEEAPHSSDAETDSDSSLSSEATASREAEVGETYESLEFGATPNSSAQECKSERFSPRFFSPLLTFLAHTRRPSDNEDFSFPNTPTSRNQRVHRGITRVPVREPRPSTAKGVIFIVPGLCSHGQTNYIQSFVIHMQRCGYHCCILTTRGLGTTPLTRRFLFNGAYTRDIRKALEEFFTTEAITRRFGRPLPVIGVGLSIGGAMLSKYLGEQGRSGDAPHLDAAVTVCAPNDYASVVEHMNRGTYQKLVYQPDMCGDVRNYLLTHKPLQELPNVDNDWVFTQGNIHRFTRVVHFDQHVIAKSAGYRSMHHYHTDASAASWLPYSPVPTLVLASFDDPVLGRSVMPHRWKDMIENNPRLVYVEPRAGGHIGFLGGPLDELMNKANWMERFVQKRCDAVCEYWQNTQQNPQGSSGLVRVVSETEAIGNISDTRATEPTFMEYESVAVKVAPESVTTSDDRLCGTSVSEAPGMLHVASAEDVNQRVRRQLANEDKLFMVRLGNLDSYAMGNLSSSSSGGDGCGDVPNVLPSGVESVEYQSGSRRIIISAKGDASRATTTDFSTGPPPEDRKSNRCYFAHRCASVATEYPEERLYRNYFARPSPPSLPQELEGVESNGDGTSDKQQQQPSSSSQLVERTTDGSGKMAVASRNISTIVGFHGGDGGGGCGGGSAHWSMRARSSPYLPIVTNADYLVDPRTLMGRDL